MIHKATINPYRVLCGEKGNGIRIVFGQLHFLRQGELRCPECLIELSKEPNNETLEELEEKDRKLLAMRSAWDSVELQGDIG